MRKRSGGRKGMSDMLVFLALAGVLCLGMWLFLK